MSKATVATILMLVALLASGWALLVGILAPFGAVGLGAFVVFVAGGIASLGAAIVAARQPRQVVILGIASLLSLGHIFLWSWIALISSGGV
jgi:hypothetical protein